MGKHRQVWSSGNIPVFCVVFDPESEGLYWANATAQLRGARFTKRSLNRIVISRGHLLSDETLPDFAAHARRYLGRFEGARAVRTHLSELSGVEFDEADYLQHFINEYGEHLIFWQETGGSEAVLLHSDLDWEQHPITFDMLSLGSGLAEGLRSRGIDPATVAGLGAIPTIGDIILNLPEAAWLTACFGASHARYAEYGEI